MDVMMGGPENRIAKCKIRSLPLDLWPEADRTAWVSACRPPARLKRGGAAGHLKPITRNDLARRYGYFLDFLDRHSLLQVDTLAATCVTPKNVGGYIAELKQRVGSVTLYGSIYKLRRAAEIIAPSLDFTWLAELEKDLALVMQPRSKFDRIVLIEVLVEAALTLIHDAETSPNLSCLARARQFRNGLMVALLGMCPIRLKNFATLEIGRSFVEIKGRWWIVLAASETKENRPDERPIHELLTPVIDRYLNQHRPVLARTDNPVSALWLSSNDGAPMSYAGVEGVIKATTLSTVGVDMSPHLFRASGASTVATYGGHNPHLASALLHHTDANVTNAHYNRATSLTAADRLRQLVRQDEKKMNRDRP